MLPNNSVSFIINNVKGMQSSKKRSKLMQYFKDRIGSTGVLFLEKLTLTAKLSKNGKKTLKVQFCFLMESQILVAS